MFYQLGLPENVYTKSVKQKSTEFFVLKKVWPFSLELGFLKGKRQ